LFDASDGFILHRHIAAIRPLHTVGRTLMEAKDNQFGINYRLITGFAGIGFHQTGLMKARRNRFKKGKKREKA